jgi:hypothetical protein
MADEDDKQILSEESQIVSQIRSLQLRLVQIAQSQSSLNSSAPESPRRTSIQNRSSKSIKRYETPLGHAKRLIIVANRLPISLHKNSDGEWGFKISAGGLVSALTSIKDLPMLWIGWPGAVVEDQKEREEIDAKLKMNHYIPVWMAKSNDLKNLFD